MSLFEVLIPIKATHAKSRLGRANRAELAAAFLTDVLDACAQAAMVSQVHVVPDAGGGLNGDVQAVHDSLGRPRAAVILGDLPCLTSSLIDELLACTPEQGRWFVSDTSGIGTTMLGVGPGQHLDPRFGARSRAAHRLSGAVELQVTDPTSNARLHRDVDTEIDLWDALRLGVGVATARVSERA